MLWLFFFCEKYDSIVMEQVENIFVPDFGKSRYLKENPALTSVNSLLIDLNDFQFFMPPIQYFPLYTEKSVDRICTDLEKGQIRQSEFPSYVIQAHIPYIAPRDLVNVYPLFEL